MGKEKEERKPVALWKGIVGTALSGTGIICFTPIVAIYLGLPKDGAIWTIFSIFAVALFFAVVFFPINLINLIQAVKYKKAHRNDENATDKEAEKEPEQDDNTELLRKMLKEGRITIEEYDQLKKK